MEVKLWILEVKVRPNQILKILSGILEDILIFFSILEDLIIFYGIFEDLLLFFWYLGRTFDIF